MSFFASRSPSGVAPEARWCQLRLRTTVYAIRPGRSFHDAAPILGPDFDGVLVRDGWAPYRQFTDALHQTCLAHLLRRCRTLRADHPRSPWAAAVQQVLADALALRDRRDAHTISDHGLAVAPRSAHRRCAGPARGRSFRGASHHRVSRRLRLLMGREPRRDQLARQDLRTSDEPRWDTHIGIMV